MCPYFCVATRYLISCSIAVSFGEISNMTKLEEGRWIILTRTGDLIFVLEETVMSVVARRRRSRF